MFFEFRDIQTKAQRFSGVDLLTATWRAESSVSFIHTLTFGAGASSVGVGSISDDDVKPIRDLKFGDSVVMTVRSRDTQRIPFVVAGQPLEAESLPAEPDFFAGKNVGLAVHNLESLDTVLQWLEYHVTQQGMNGALIVCRQRDSLGNQFANKLERKARKIKGLERLMLWSIDLPLGKVDEPSEAHPFTVKGAPGKDRMTDITPDPQTSPLGRMQIYEMLRHSYLGRARAVMNIDVHDLILPGQGASVFDKAVQSETGLVSLSGNQCYPWRLRKNEDAAFGDHVFVPFDTQYDLGRWCICPAGDDTEVWRVVRIVGREPEGEATRFARYIALKHPHDKVAQLVPKSSLIRSEELDVIARKYFKHKPVDMPDAQKNRMSKKEGTAIVTTMKNEGPFILEWLAYHRVIGVNDFIVYTNDCTDGTDTFLELLQTKGLLQHRNNAFEGTGLKPQHHALREAEGEPTIQNAQWVICMDVDEYINVKVGDGTLAALYDAVGTANMIAINWRLFGNNDVHEFQDAPIIGQFTKCAPEYTRKPHQAWGFKTLFRNNGIFRKLGVHRPKGLKPQLWNDIEWVNGSGKDIPKDMFRNAWRSTTETYGYDMVQLNHYAVRSAESFLVKRDRGRVNHVDRDQGLSYWFRMNNNTETNTDIARMLPALEAEMAKLMSDPDIAAAHKDCVQRHRAKIKDLKATQNYSDFYDTLTSERQERLSRLHQHFGANVFLVGPDCVPDAITMQDQDSDFFFTVEDGKTTH